MNERPCVSVVVPTKNEEGNIGALLVRLQREFLDLDHEVILVDAGSTDDTIIEARRVMPDVRLIRDHEGSRTSATRAGIRVARGKHIITMDGDLQHDPLTARRLYETAEETGADIVNASRYVPGGIDRAHGPIGRALAGLPRGTAWMLLPKVRALGITDPHSRFFLVRNGITGSVQAQRDGALLLSILHEAPIRKTVEIGYIHNPRGHGRATTTLRDRGRDIAQLAHFANTDPENERAGTYGLVGLNGFAVTLLSLTLLAGYLNVHPVLAAVAALEVSILATFIGHEKITYARRHPTDTMGQRAAAYYVDAHNPATLNIAIFTMLHVVFGVHWLWAEYFALYSAAALSYGADMALSYPFAMRMRASVNKVAQAEALRLGREREAALEAIRIGEPAPSTGTLQHDTSIRPAVPLAVAAHNVLPTEAWDPAAGRPAAQVELLGATTAGAPRDLDPGFVRITWSEDGPNPPDAARARAEAEARFADLVKP